MISNLYEAPKKGVKLEDCFYYHTIDIPGIGTIEGHWDLRQVAGRYLGNVNFSGQRVLEIGPASGFLTAYMEQHGADVVAVELPNNFIWDFVPYKKTEQERENILKRKKYTNEQLKNSFWFTHKHFGLKAKVHYGKVSNLPEELGCFDISLIGMTLTHTRDPVTIIENCAALTKKKLIIVERLFNGHKTINKPLIELIPSKANNRVDSWWSFSETLFTQLLELMGFTKVSITETICSVNGKPYPVSTFVAEW